MKPKQRIPLAMAAFAMTIGSAQSAITLLSENWQTAGMASGDINSATNAPLTGWAGFGLNNDNITMLLTPSGGNVLRDQGGFGGTYGAATDAGNATRVRSSNGAMLNESPLMLTTLNLTSVTFSFDLKQVTANYVQVVEFSNNIGFLTTGTTGGENNNVLLLDTFNGNTNLTFWLAKTYTLTDNVQIGFTDQSYFRIRKLRPSPGGTNAGANGTFHVYDNLVISGVEAVPEPSAALLGSLGALALLRRRR